MVADDEIISLGRPDLLRLDVEGFDQCGRRVCFRGGPGRKIERESVRRIFWDNGQRYTPGLRLLKSSSTTTLNPEEQRNMNEQDISNQLVGILTDMTSDWDIELDSNINRETRLIADLAFESIDIVELVVAIELTFNSRGIPFERLLMVDGRYVDDLSVAQVSDFVAANL